MELCNADGTAFEMWLYWRMLVCDGSFVLVFDSSQVSSETAAKYGNFITGIISSATRL